MSPQVYGYGILGIAIAGILGTIYVLLSHKKAEATGQKVGAAKQAAKDRAQSIVDAAAQGPDALEAEGRKVFAELDKELEKKP